MTDSHTSAPAPRRNGRDVVLADIHCRACLRTLRHEPIRRAETHRLPVVTCPACGAVNAAEMYPVSSGIGGVARWIGAASWLLILVVLLFFTFMPLPMISYGTGWAGARQLEELIRTRFEAHIAEESGTEPPAENAFPAYLSGDTDFEAWWETQDPGALIDELGGWWSAVDWERIWAEWWPVLPTYFGIGIVWAGLLCGRPALHRALIGLACGGLAVILALPLAFADIGPSWRTTAYNVASGLVGPGVTVVGIAAITLVFIAGVTLGGPVIRGLVRALLPRRERLALGPLGQPRKERANIAG